MFGRAGRAAGDRPKRSATVSVVGADMEVSGDVTTEEALRVDGRIEGNVRCGVLELGEHGTVAGDVLAQEVHIAGRVLGRVEARVVALEAAARVSGDVCYESLAVAAGALVEGRLSHRAGSAPIELPLKTTQKSKAARPQAVAPELFAQAAE
jgi:cytoskeletal protein CcmA (bactofilin family)